MPITDLEKLKVAVEAINRRDENEKRRLIVSILSYKDMNEVIKQQTKIPPIEEFVSDVHSRFTLFNMEEGVLKQLTIEKLKYIEKHLIAWDKFISQYIKMILDEHL